MSRPCQAQNSWLASAASCSFGPFSNCLPAPEMWRPADLVRQRRAGPHRARLERAGAGADERACRRGLDRYKADRRRLVLILNSPGGSIEHGRKVVAAIRARDRAIDTLVQKAGVCASMCVPIFLAGTKRMADPEAYFMFHQASLNSSAGRTMKRQEFSDIRESPLLASRQDNRGATSLTSSSVATSASAALTRPGLTGCVGKSRAAISG